MARLFRALPGAALAARLDRTALVALRTRGHPLALERAAIAFTRAGENGALWIGLSLVGAGRRSGVQRRQWLRATAAVPAALGVNYLVKRLVRRQRPRLPGLPPLARAPRTYSFPSGHAATAFAASRALARLAPRARLPLAAAAATMALTRPYLGLHYPSDVLAGAALGDLAARAAGRR